MKKIWKDIKGYEGIYAISTKGDVKSYAKKWVAANGSKRSHKTMILSKSTNSDGYYSLRLK